jgi:hypothetical protein
MNHTNRAATAFKFGGNLNNLLSKIDSLVVKYHILRNEGLPEEINFDNLSNLSQENKNTLCELVRYFMFIGTGRGISYRTADSLIVIDGDNIKFIRLKTKQEQMEYIKDHWGSFNLSLVSRKNPGGLKYKEDMEERCSRDVKFKKKYEIMEPWIYETTDNGRNNPENKIKLKTALHIRMKCV